MDVPKDGLLRSIAIVAGVRRLPADQDAAGIGPVVEIVGQAMTICGMAGYRNDTELSLTRQLRDAYGAALMVNNDRILGASAQMLLIHRGD